MAAYTEEYVQSLLAENDRLRTLVESLKTESEAQVANLASLYVAVTSVHGALDRPSVGIEPRAYQNISVGEGAIGRAAATGERLSRSEGGSLSEDGDASLTACIPLKVAGRVVGVQAVFRLLPHKLRLDAIDIDLFDVLAAHAASALLFTRLYAASGGNVGATA